MHKRIEQFNLSHFKKWVNNQNDHESKSNLIGVQVESKITLKKLVSRMETQEGEIEEVAKEFKDSGGTITEVNGHNLLIEVKSGNFLIHRMHVKKLN